MHTSLYSRVPRSGRPSLCLAVLTTLVLVLGVTPARAADGDPPVGGEPPAAAGPVAPAAPVTPAPDAAKPLVTMGLSLAGATPGADVFVDGEKVGTTPLKGVIAATAGEHTIRVVRPGYAPYIDVFKVRDGRVTRVEAELVPVAGVLRLRSSQSKARVFVDGRFVGEAPIEAELKAGLHQVKVSGFGFREETLTVTAVAGEVLEREVQLTALPPGENPNRPVGVTPPKWYEKWWVWTAGAVGVAAIATAVIVPTVLASRGVCERLDAELCVTVPAPATVGTTSPALLLRFGGRF